MKVLLTGSTGRIGPFIVPDLNARYDLRTFDLKANQAVKDAYSGSITNFKKLRRAMQGVETVMHFAAVSDEAPFEKELVPNNVVGVYNVLEAARLENVRRVIFASSIQTVGCYPPESHVQVTDPPRPNTLYGATKILAEAMGRNYYDKHGLEFIAIRIGACQAYESPHLKYDFLRRIWLSPRDLAQLVVKAIDTPDVGFAVVNGTSRTNYEYLTLKAAREVLGYVPEDSDEDIVIAAIQPPIVGT